MSEELVCWRCGGSLGELMLPVRRQEECPACGVDLHACRMCEFFDTRVARQCREPVAEEVKDKQRANFCDYFQPRPGAHAPGEHEQAERARAELEALFGAGAPGDAHEPSDADEARSALDELFGLRGED